MTRIAWLVLVLVLVLVGCASLFGCADTDTTQVPQRGPGSSAGKADHGGSCQGYCGEQAATGCWCDEQCDAYGDCCADKAAVCEISCATICEVRGNHPCFNRQKCATHCAAQSPTWSELEVDAFTSCVQTDPLCYWTPQNCMSSQLRRRCDDLCEQRGPSTACFGQPACMSFCEARIADWTHSEYEAFATCATTDPLCHLSIESCMGVQ